MLAPSLTLKRVKRVRTNKTKSITESFRSNNLENEPIFIQANNKFFTVAFLEIGANSRNRTMSVPAISKYTSRKDEKLDL